MIYGRVIGNELRDVPPECLPIWGQRWSGYRAPHGPSPFSTRIFSVDRMFQMGPALTSPTQFEATLTEEDEGEDTSSESNRLYSTFLSSPLSVQPDDAELTSLPEIPTPRFVHPSPSHPYGSPKIPHRSTAHPPPQNSTCFSTTFLPRQRSEQSSIQHHASEPLFHPSALHHGVSIQGGCGSFENDYTLWNMDRTSTNIQPHSGPSHGSHVQSGQLHYTVPPHSIPEWQFASAHTHSSAHPFKPNPSSHPGSSYLLQPFQADDRTRFIPTTPPSSSHCFTIPFPQQNVGVDSSWNHDLSRTMTPCIAHPQNRTISQWPAGSVPPNPSFLGPLQNSWSSPSPGAFYHLVSDHHRNPHPEDLLGTFAHAEGCTLLSFDKLGGDHFTR